jgi:outer membrane protein
MKLARFAALCSVLLAGGAPAEDLMAVYQRALSADPSIREAEANRRATREARPQAWSAILPQISGSASKDETESDSFTQQPREIDGQVVIFGGTGTSQPETDRWSVDLRQNLFSWANWVTVRRAGREVAQAEADYQAAEQDLVLRVSERYFDVLAAQDNVEAQQAALDAISRQLEQAEKRFEVGLIAITDVEEAKAARDSGAAALIAAKRSLASAEELLREITNEKYQSLAKPRPDMPLNSPQPASEEQWVEASLQQNLALISSRLAADIARDNVRVAFSGHLPTLDLVASRSSSDLTSPIEFASGNRGEFINDSDDDSITLQFSVPIFSGGATQSRVREQEFRWQAARERLTRTTRQTERLARDAYLGVISEISRVQALRQALESSQTALKATEAGYEVGTRTAVDVLDARRTLVQAQTNYARSRYDYILNVLRLKLAAGNLDKATLDEVNGWLAEEGK